VSPVHHVILAVVFALVGCCVGSFLNVCIHRIPRGLSLLRPRSRCPGCRSAIRPVDNLPVLSWLILRGKCRDCGCAISRRYVLVELGVGLLFALVYLIEAVLAPADLWERMGAVLAFCQLLMLWAVTSIFVTAAIMAYDRKTSRA